MSDDPGSGLYSTGGGVDSGLSTSLVWYYAVVNFLYEQMFRPIGDWDAAGFFFSPAGLWVWVLLGLLCCCMPYMCFQKHLLPHDCGKLVGRAYFWPCIPCTIYGNKVEFKGQWWAHVDDEPAEVLLGQAPLFGSQLRELERMGVKAIINLCDEFKGNSRYYKKKGISLLWLRTVDHLEPTVEAMHTACSFIAHARKNGHGVYIHCKSGRGRSAAIAMAWLMYHRGMSPKQAQEHLLRQRKVRSKLWKQRNVIQFYEDIGGVEAGAEADVEMGGLRRHRTISFATPKPKPPLVTLGSGGGTPGRSRCGSMDVKRDILRAPLHSPLGEYGVDERPPDWEEEGDGVWEINVAPGPRFEDEFDTDDADDELRGTRQAAPPKKGAAKGATKARKAPFKAPFKAWQPPRQPPPSETSSSNAGLVSTAV